MLIPAPCRRFDLRCGTAASIVYSSDTLADPAVIEVEERGCPESKEGRRSLGLSRHHDLVIHGRVALIHILPEILEPLSVRSRGILVHTTEDAIPVDPAQLAQVGFRRDGGPGRDPTAGEPRCALAGAVRSIEYFRDLPLDRAVQVLEVAQSALMRRVSPSSAAVNLGRIRHPDGRCRVLFGEVDQKVMEEHEYLGKLLLQGTPQR